MIDRLNGAPSLPGIDEPPDEFTTTMPPILVPPTVPPGTLPPVSTTSSDPDLLEQHPMALALVPR
jgi:hypothetical protein